MPVVLEGAPLPARENPYIAPFETADFFPGDPPSADAKFNAPPASTASVRGSAFEALRRVITQAEAQTKLTTMSKLSMRRRIMSSWRANFSGRLNKDNIPEFVEKISQKVRERILFRANDDVGTFEDFAPVTADSVITLTATCIRGLIGPELAKKYGPLIARYLGVKWLPAFCLVEAARRFGKTRTISALLATVAYFATVGVVKRPLLIMIAAQTKDIAIEIMGKVVQHIEDMGLPIQHKTTEHTTLYGGVHIIPCTTAKPKNVRGRTPAIFFVDEAALAPDSLYPAIIPFTIHGGVVIGATSPTPIPHYQKYYCKEGDRSLAMFREITRDADGTVVMAAMAQCRRMCDACLATLDEFLARGQIPDCTHVILDSPAHINSTDSITSNNALSNEDYLAEVRGVTRQGDTQFFPARHLNHFLHEPESLLEYVGKGTPTLVFGTDPGGIGSGTACVAVLYFRNKSEYVNVDALVVGKFFKGGSLLPEVVGSAITNFVRAVLDKLLRQMPEWMYTMPVVVCSEACGKEMLCNGISFACCSAAVAAGVHNVQCIVTYKGTAGHEVGEAIRPDSARFPYECGFYYLEGMRARCLTEIRDMFILGKLKLFNEFATNFESRQSASSVWASHFRSMKPETVFASKKGKRVPEDHDDFVFALLGTVHAITLVTTRRDANPNSRGVHIVDGYDIARIGKNMPVY